MNHKGEKGQFRRGMRNEYPCGCWISYDNAGVYLIEWCPLHKTANDLLEACKEMLKIFGNPNSTVDQEVDVMTKTRQAIAKAEWRDEG